MLPTCPGSGKGTGYRGIWQESAFQVIFFSLSFTRDELLQQSCRRISRKCWLVEPHNVALRDDPEEPRNHPMSAYSVRVRPRSHPRGEVFFRDSERPKGPTNRMTPRFFAASCTSWRVVVEGVLTHRRGVMWVCHAPFLAGFFHIHSCWLLPELNGYSSTDSTVVVGYAPFYRWYELVSQGHVSSVPSESRATGKRSENEKNGTPKRKPGTPTRSTVEYIAGVGCAIVSSPRKIPDALPSATAGEGLLSRGAHGQRHRAAHLHALAFCIHPGIHRSL